MKYEEAIERIENLKVKAEVSLHSVGESYKWLKEDVKGTITAFSMAIEAIEKQATKQATSNYTSEWIPVSERLPEELVAVNVTWINRCPENYYMHIKDKPFTDTAVLYQGEWYWWDSTIIDYLSECGTCISGVVNKSIDILAWQPLPEPWKGEVNE